MKFSFTLALSAVLLVITPTSIFGDDDGFDEVESGHTDPYSENENDVGGVTPNFPDSSYGGGGDEYGGYGGGYGDGLPPSSIKDFDSLDEIKSFIQQDPAEVVVIGYFDALTNKEDKAVFEELADVEGRNYRFALSTKKEVLEELKYDGSVVFVYKPSKYVSEKYEKARARYPSKTLKRDSLLKFIAEKSLPLVGERTVKNGDQYDKLKAPVLTVFADIDAEKNPKGFTYIANRLRKVAKEIGNKIVFNIASKEDNSLLTQYHVPALGRSESALRIAHSDLVYSVPEPFSQDAVKRFLTAFQQGELQGVPKASSPTSHDEDSDEDDSSPSDVITLTDANFKEEVTDSDANVMIEFYAPWCGHCKALKPEYKQLAAKFKSDSTVKIAAMDATAHKVPAGYDVSGYPTLYFRPAGSKAAVPYDGERTAEAMAEYINEKKA